MKHNARFKNTDGTVFDVSSMETYQLTEQDLQDFTKVLSDPRVCEYITDDAMAKYGHATVESLAEDILGHSALRWQEGKEKRFLIRTERGDPVGMIGVTLQTPSSGELWYYKPAFVPPFIQAALSVVLPMLRVEGVVDLMATVEPSNKRSAAILADLGFTVDGGPGHGLWRKRLWP